MSRKDLQREIDELLADLRLVDKRDTPTVQLSGGQKRKLRSFLTSIDNRNNYYVTAFFNASTLCLQCCNCFDWRFQDCGAG